MAIRYREKPRYWDHLAGRAPAFIADYSSSAIRLLEKVMKKEDLTLACAAADLQLDVQLLEQVGEGSFEIGWKLAAGADLV